MVRGFSRFVLFLFVGLSGAPTRNSPERVCDTMDLFQKKWEPPRFSFSQIQGTAKYLLPPPPPPREQEGKSSEGNSGSIQPYGRYENAGRSSKTISTIATRQPVRVLFREEGRYGGGRYFHFHCHRPSGPENSQKKSEKQGLFEALQRSHQNTPKFTWSQLGPFFVPACPPLTAINGHERLLTAIVVFE